MPRMKGFLNRLVDDIIHPDGVPKTAETIVADEVLHAIIEGGFRADKFLRYTVLPRLRKTAGHRRYRRRKRRQNSDVLPLP